MSSNFLPLSAGASIAIRVLCYIAAAALCFTGGYGIHWYLTARSNDIPVFDPSGVVRLVSQNLYQDALWSGGEPAFHMIASNGEKRWAKLSELKQAKDAGMAGISEREKGRILEALSSLSKVDSSWVSAARSCWLGLAAQSDGTIHLQLSHSSFFRGTFPKYSILTDSDVMRLAQKPFGLTISPHQVTIGQFNLTSGIETSNPTLEKKWYILRPDPQSVSLRPNGRNSETFDGLVSRKLKAIKEDEENEWFCDVSTGIPERK